MTSSKTVDEHEIASDHWADLAKSKNINERTRVPAIARIGMC